jgi:hypothetical protein
MIWIVIPIVAAVCFVLWFSPVGEEVGIWRWPK